jgi:hypothetical protein
MHSICGRFGLFMALLCPILAASGLNAPYASAQGQIILKTKDFGAGLSFDKEGKLTYESVKGMAGVGTTEQEALANLTPVRLGTDPEGKPVIYIEQKNAVRGLTVFYLDATSGVNLDKAMWALFEVKALETQFLAGDNKAEAKLRGYLTHESALVRQAAGKALKKRGAQRHKGND